MSSSVLVASVGMFFWVAAIFVFAAKHKILASLIFVVGIVFVAIATSIAV